MKIRAALTAALVAAASVATMLSVPASAADMKTVLINDFETLTTADVGSAATAENGFILSIDETTSAHDGSKSLKVQVDPSQHCYFWRVIPEESYLFSNMYYDMLNGIADHDIYFTFWAKASEPTMIDPLLYIMKTLYLPNGYHAYLTTEWQKFSYRINDAVGQEKDKTESFGKTILECLQTGGSAANDKKDAYMHSLRFDREDQGKDGRKNFTGTIWIDDICFTGEKFSAGSKDSPGKDEFDPDDGYFQMKYVDTATYGSTETIMPPEGGAAPAASSAVEEVSSAAEEVSSEEASSEEVSSEEVSSAAVSSTASEAEEGGLSTGAIVGIVIAVIVVIAGVCVGVYFYKKKQGEAPDGDAPDDNASNDNPPSDTEA